MLIRTKIIFLTLFLLIGVGLYAKSSFAATINIANYGDGTCSIRNAQSAYDVASAGDTIIFPLNSKCSWSSSLTIGKPITINGNGTILTASGDLVDGKIITGFFNIAGFTANKMTRITGFTFNLVNYTANCAIIVHNMTGGVSNGDIRIDNNKIYNGYEGIDFYHGKGLIDNNYFYNVLKGVSFTSGSRVNADESWESLAAGTADALYIEDNNFVTDTNYPLTYTQEQVGTYQGGKLVVRHNDFNFDNIPDAVSGTATPFMAHGNADAGCEGIGYWEYDADTTRCTRRGQSVIEFYDNTMHGKRIDYFYTSRGSANLIYNNRVTSTVKYSPATYFYEEEYFIWNTIRVTWPAEDQVHNSFIWNNTYMNNPMTTVVTAPSNSSCESSGYPMPCCTGNHTGTCSASNYIAKDRDYFLHAPCGASNTTDAYGNVCTHGKETFICASGVNKCNGASNTYPTNGSTYPTKGTMIFTNAGDNAYLNYAPYVYPHPLQNESGDDTTSPAAPSGLTVN